MTDVSSADAAPGLGACYDCGMTETTQTTKPTSEKDFVTRLADAGEEALQRLADLPGGQKAITAVNDLRARVDDLTKKELASLKRAEAPTRRQAPRKPASS